MEDNNVCVGCGQMFEFTTDSEFWINKIIDRAASAPGDVKILMMPAENGGSIKALVRQEFMDIRPERIVPDVNDEGVCADGRA